MRQTSVAAPTPGGLRGAIDAVNRFFFAPSDTATLGLIRICAGFLVLYVHLMYSYDLYRLFGKDALLSHDLVTETRNEYPVTPSEPDWEGNLPKLPPPADKDEAKKLADYKMRWLAQAPDFDPRNLVAKGYYVWSVWFHVTDPTWMVVVHVGFLLCMLLFALGLWTPVTGLVTWLAMLSYVNRATTTYFGMDTIMNVLVLYLTLAHLFARPGTAALSLDRLLWRWRNADKGVNLSDTTSSSATFAIRLMQIHFCLIYMGSGWSKLMGSAWWNGTAIWLTLANPEFADLNMNYYRTVIVWLCRHRVLWEISMTGGAIFTLLLEVGLPFLIWVPKLRWVMVIGSILLHTGIALFMGLSGFSLMMLTLLVAFIPPATVRQLLGLTEAEPALRPAKMLVPA